MSSLLFYFGAELRALAHATAVQNNFLIAKQPTFDADEHVNEKLESNGCGQECESSDKMAKTKRE